MRVSRGLLTIIAETGDEEAQSILREWEKEDKTDRKSAVHFRGFFTLTPLVHTPRTLTAGGIGTPVFNHIPTLTGIRSGAGLYSQVDINDKKE
jgi:hypothetical protein